MSYRKEIKYRIYKIACLEGTGVPYCYQKKQQQRQFNPVHIIAKNIEWDFIHFL
jgi:hypothetical protein